MSDDTYGNPRCPECGGPTMEYWRKPDKPEKNHFFCQDCGKLWHIPHGWQNDTITVRYKEVKDE